MVKMSPTSDEKLKQFFVKHQNPETLWRDVKNVIRKYPNLHPDSDSFVFNNGSSQNLFNLQGTIPVTYKGNVYNIPVRIWILNTHPNNAPMCYVTPTVDMTIQVSMFVDHNGKIYLPYLHDWVPHSSNLLSLIQIMCLTFGDKPPVFAKRSIEPALNPYPTQSFMPMPGAASNAPGGSFSPFPSNSLYGSGTPYLPYPISGYSGNPVYPQAGGLPNFTSSGYPNSFPTPYPPAQPSPPMAGAINSGNSDTITEEHIRASLLSAVGDQLRRRLCEQFSQLQAELETLRRTEEELQNGSTKLKELFSKLQKEKQELEKNITILQDKEGELEKEIEKLSDNQSIDVDEAVTTIAPLYKQMISVFAEEAATEDAIYYLDEGLRQGSIDLDVFLRYVRLLSRKQFLLRALMDRCREKAGLAG